MAIWGRDKLAKRSTRGKPSNYGSSQADAKPPLTPSKAAVVRDCFEDWLALHGASGDVLKDRLGSLNQYLVSAMRDSAQIVRRAKISREEKENQEIVSDHGDQEVNDTLEQEDF